MIRLLAFVFSVAMLCFTGPAAAQRADRATPGYVRVRILTTEGPIVLALNTRRAPRTTENFLDYVDDKRFDGISFYRAARRKSAPELGFVQGGIQSDVRRLLPPFPHESTARTGILHLDGTISMARRAEPGSAGGNFFITVGRMPSMDAKGAYAGYAAFGRVVSGMPIVRKILAKPTAGGSAAMRGQMIARPVRIVSMRRLDGAPDPTGRVKPWKLKTRAERARVSK
jgi:peptidyl-prolyl cis-trans isomerase A (cyclophilin A)